MSFIVGILMREVQDANGPTALDSGF
jgi:hypothetical protein